MWEKAREERESASERHTVKRKDRYSIISNIRRVLIGSREREQVLSFYKREWEHAQERESTWERQVLSHKETLMIESCDTHEWVMSHIWVSHGTYMNEHVLDAGVSWETTGPARLFPSTHFDCWVDMCDMTYSYVWHDSFICVTWLIHKCDMTHSYVWQVSFHRLISIVGLTN